MLITLQLCQLIYSVMSLHRALGASAVSYDFMQMQLARVPAIYAVVCNEPKKEITLTDTSLYGMTARYQVLSNDDVILLSDSIANYCHGKYRVFVGSYAYI
jgi:hypothetical protein